MVKVELKIDGMACGMCEAHINDAISDQWSVRKLKSSWKKGTTTFLSEIAPSEEDLHDILDPAGYKLLSVKVEAE